MKRRNKYNATKTTVDGITFDSKKESQRYSELKLLEMAGKISRLKMQPRLPIKINGKKICEYRADFYYVEDGVNVIEDVKSEHTRTLPVYRLKKKLVEAVYGITIRET